MEEYRDIGREELHHGQRCSIEINGKYTEDAKISISDSGRVFVCQNIAMGTPAPDLLGYTCSWYMLSPRGSFLSKEGVKRHKLRLFPPEPKTLIDQDGEEREILFTTDDMVVTD